MRLTGLKKKHAALVASMEAILDKALDSAGVVRDLTADENTAFEKLEAEANGIEKSIVREKSMLARVGVSKDTGNEDDPEGDDQDEPALPTRKAAARARDTRASIERVAGRQKGNTVAAQAKEPGSVFEKMGVILWAAYAHKAAPEISTADHIERKGYGQIADSMRETREKALNSGTLTAGSELIPLEFSTEFIEFIRPKTSIMRAGPTIIPLDAGNLRISGGDVGATASYRTEGSDAPYTQATFKEKTLAAKILTAVTSITKELLQRSPLAVAAIVQNDIAAAWIHAQDLAALRGDGTGNTPVGLKNLMSPGNVINVAPGLAPSYQIIDLYALQLIENIEGADIPTMNPVWFMATRIVNYLRTLRGVNGEKIYPEMDGANPTFHGYPVFKTNQIPKNLGLTTDMTEIYLCDMGHFWYGDAGSMEISLSDEASFVQGGTLISAWSRNLIAVKVNGSHDFALRFDKAAGMLANVQWGAQA